VRRIRRRRRRLQNADINITNLVDVTMTLLVVFMIVAPLLKQGLQIELPEARVSESIASDDKVVLVEYDRQGNVTVNQRETVVGRVEETVRGLIEELGERRVQVRADKDLPFGSVVSLMGEIQAAGVEQIALETVKMKVGG